MHEKDAHLAAGPVTVAPKRQQAVVLLAVLIATGVEWGGDQYVDYGGRGEGKAAVVQSSVLFRPPPTHTPPNPPTPLSPVPDNITQSPRVDQSQRSRARVTACNSAAQQQKPKQRFDSLSNYQATTVHTHSPGEGEGFRTQHAVGDKLH